MSQADASASPGNAQCSQNKRQSTGVFCTQCKSVAKAGQHMLRCLGCGNAIHVACQCKAFKDAGNEAIKNRIDWLAEYIAFAGLVYHCKACRDKHDVAPQDSATLANQTIVAVNQSIVALDTKIQQLHNAIAQLGPRNNEVSPTTVNSHKDPPSYAAAVSANDVKSAVSEAILEQQNVKSNQSCVVIYGFPEEGDDYGHLLDMFDFLNCRCVIIHCSRLGRQISQHPRPIKAELGSPSEANRILSVTRRLREVEYYHGVNISKWLSREELESVKCLRKQCADLNSAAKTAGKSRPPFIVISGRLMERTGGQLRPYVASAKPKHQLSQQTRSPPSEPKNDQQGSQVAPSKQ